MYFNSNAFYIFVKSLLPLHKIVVHKKMRLLELFEDEKLVFRCTIQLGLNPIGHKSKQGDGKTPEGLYTLNAKNDKSKFYKNVGISYPEPKDLGEEDPGDNIKIHALPNDKKLGYKFYSNFDWTEGCIAIAPMYMDIIFEKCEIGTKIIILK